MKSRHGEPLLMPSSLKTKRPLQSLLGLPRREESIKADHWGGTTLLLVAVVVW